MTGLSSIRQLFPGTSPLPGVADAPDAAGVSIPAAELRQLNAGTAAGSTTSVQPASGSFSNLLGQMVNEVNSRQQIAGQALQDLQSGQNVPLHQAVIAMEEASVSFQLMVEVRNRLLESYQEIMRMQM